MKISPQLILTLIFMVAVLIYTVWNYLNGGTSPMMLAIAVATTVYVIYGIVRSYRDQRK